MILKGLPLIKNRGGERRLTAIVFKFFWLGACVIDLDLKVIYKKEWSPSYLVSKFDLFAAVYSKLLK